MTELDIIEAERSEHQMRLLCEAGIPLKYLQVELSHPSGTYTYTYMYTYARARAHTHTPAD